MTSLATPMALPLRRGTCRFRAMLAGFCLLRQNIDIVTGSRMSCRVTTVEVLPSSTASIPVGRFSTLINRSAPFRRSLISTPGHHLRIPGKQSQHECRHILRNPTGTNSTDRRISSQVITNCLSEMIYLLTFVYVDMCVGATSCAASCRLPDYRRDRCCCRSESGRCPVADQRDFHITGRSSISK